MIEAEADTAFAALTVRLTRKAARLAEAHAQRRRLAKRDNPARWRRASLVWPLFGQG